MHQACHQKGQAETMNDRRGAARRLDEGYQDKGDGGVLGEIAMGADPPL